MSSHITPCWWRAQCSEVSSPCDHHISRESRNLAVRLLAGVQWLSRSRRDCCNGFVTPDMVGFICPRIAAIVFSQVGPSLCRRVRCGSSFCWDAGHLLKKPLCSFAVLRVRGAINSFPVNKTLSRYPSGKFYVPLQRIYLVLMSKLEVVGGIYTIYHAKVCGKEWQRRRCCTNDGGWPLNKYKVGVAFIKYMQF